jgi:Amt family ammonium transporter
MGLTAGFVCYGGVLLKHKLGYDDSLDAFGVHGVGGAWGAIATGLFATVGASGLIAGNPLQLWTQLVGLLAAGAYAVIVTLLIIFALKAVMGLRVSEEDEVRGLDQTAHSETGYTF